MCCVCRDEVLLPAAARVGLADARKAVAAAAEVYRQVFEEETDAAAPETAAAAAARMLLLRGWRVALGLTAADVSSLHAEAYRVRLLFYRERQPHQMHACMHACMQTDARIQTGACMQKSMHASASMHAKGCMHACMRFWGCCCRRGCCGWLERRWGPKGSGRRRQQK